MLSLWFNCMTCMALLAFLVVLEQLEVVGWVRFVSSTAGWSVSPTGTNLGHNDHTMIYSRAMHNALEHME